ncbi:tripartite tricarboxylate transporter substrate binding protein [Methylobacterium sp. C25]|uniref:Bug family tripartite tricarboxylate transporter substrate binding protein n=1 Tax=Methylobacterium sp. C25 TaxID=2721622 RepID=UPI001F294723|nr:tripartite tricarboxylate transporter substrate binding protein [Methylobacterium sp. C25]MCE4225599.1 tripartite tricarboxylate transporter substrate binding protein [Methylobacterium sp. C25]
MRIVSAAIAIGMSFVAGAAQAESKYPDHTVRIVVPFPPGGITDVAGRLLADKLGQKFGQSFIVDNRPGAGSIIGSDIVAKAPGDGYTILMGSIANAIIPVLYNKVPYDLHKDLTPLCQVVSVPNFLVVGASSPYKSVKDLVEAAKASPGKLTFASTGVGASPHLTGEMFKSMTGINVVHIPYKGSGPAQLDLMANRVNYMFDNGALGQVKGGKLRALATSAGKRTDVTPDLPTVAESGVPGFDITSWYGLWIPKSTPEPIVAQLRSAIAEGFADPGIKEKLAGLGADVSIKCGPDYGTFIDAETARWGELIKKIGLKLDY